MKSNFRNLISMKLVLCLVFGLICVMDAQLEVPGAELCARGSVVKKKLG